MAGKKRASVQCSSRSELLNSLRRTFTVPASRLSALTLLPFDTYSQYLLAPEWCRDLATQRHLATVSVTQGAQASVYLMEKSSTELYVMKATAVDDAERVRLAVKEYEVLKSLESPHIVKPLAFWIDKELSRAALILPYWGDQTLETVGKLPMDEVRHIALQLFEALAYLHARNWVHRDIKPANLLYFQGNLTIIDFQTATSLQDSQWFQTYAGTKEFTAPEMRSESVYSAKVDVWSAGAVLLRVLEGGVPSGDSGEWFAGVMEEQAERRFSAEEALQHTWLRSVH